jgi:putative glutamine amidotransferase
MASVVIGISKASGSKAYEMYEPWLQGSDPSVECIDLSQMPPDDAVQALASCSGLLLTDGPDVDPELYEKPEERDRCRDVDRGRDKLELALIQRARLINIPMVAIDRGMQLLNVFLGGTLFIDLASDNPTAVLHDGDDVPHPVAIVPETLLHHSCGVLEGTVNGSHHQAIDKLSWYLRVAATAPDGGIEALEWNDQTEKPFLMAVQWHPERLAFENPLSGALAASFLSAAKAYVPHHRID